MPLEDLRWWIVLSPGNSVLIVKIRPDGSTATTYNGTIIDAGAPEDWLVAEAVWTRDPIEMDGLLFNPGDRIHEYFSKSEYFNVFAVFSPDGTPRGWYANVTYPSWMGFEDGAPAIYWHDLYVDVIGLPSGEVFVRDEDELEAARPGFDDPHLFETILGARDELVRRFQSREFPFHEE